MNKTTVVNLRKDLYDVYIGRKGKGCDGYFGNPFGLEDGRDACIVKYKAYFGTRIALDEEFRFKVSKLKGLRLGCFCKPLACHGDVIVEWLDKEEK